MSGPARGGYMPPYPESPLPTWQHQLEVQQASVDKAYLTIAMKQLHHAGSCIFIGLSFMICKLGN